MLRLLISLLLDLLVALRVSIWKLRLLVGIYLLIQVVKLNVSIQAQALLILGGSQQTGYVYVRLNSLAEACTMLVWPQIAMP